MKPCHGIKRNVRQTLCLKMAVKDHQHLSGGIVGNRQKFRLFSYNLLWLFENGRKQTINHLVVILLENGRNFGRFLTTTTSCLKTAENKLSTILWGRCWKTAEISAVFQQLGFGRFPTTQNVSVVFQQTGFGRFPTIFFGRFPHPPKFVVTVMPSTVTEMSFPILMAMTVVTIFAVTV